MDAIFPGTRSDGGYCARPAATSRRQGFSPGPRRPPVWRDSSVAWLPHYTRKLSNQGRAIDASKIFTLMLVGTRGRVYDATVTKTFGFWWNHFASSNFYRSNMGPQGWRPDRWRRREGCNHINLGKKTLLIVLVPYNVCVYIYI